MTHLSQSASVCERRPLPLVDVAMAIESAKRRVDAILQLLEDVDALVAESRALGGNNDDHHAQEAASISTAAEQESMSSARP